MSHLIRRVSVAALLPVLFALLITGCAHTRDAVTTADNPNCRCVIEGIFISTPVFETYDEMVPALVLKQSSGKTKAIHDKILSVDSTGIMFDQARIGMFSDPEPKLYPYGEILCAIDSARTVIFGTLPEKYRRTWSADLVLCREGDSTSAPLKCPLKSGERFSFCIDPGTYLMKEIHFSHEADHISHEAAVDSGVMLPLMTFRAEQGKVNYLGSFVLDGDTTSCLVPVKKEDWPGKGDAGYWLGLIGSAIEAAATNYGIVGFHRLSITRDEHYTTELKLPLEYSPVTLTENPNVKEVRMAIMKKK